MGGATRKIALILLQGLLWLALAGGTILEDGPVIVQGYEELVQTAIPRTSSSDFGPCENDDDCMKTVSTLNFMQALEMDPDGQIVHRPYCDTLDNATPFAAADEYKNSSTRYGGQCMCGTDNSTGQDLCPSYTYTWDNERAWYCGPCGRIGSQCDANNSCSYTFSFCDTDFNRCWCSEGDFYELFYCYIPYYGYKMALQSTLIIGIVIAICLLIATAYNALGMRRIRRLQALGLWNRGNVTREAPPDDTPPKYDDVVEKLPSYQDALQMEENVNGIVNTAFEEDGVSLPPSYEEIKSNLNESVDKSKSNTSNMQKDGTEISSCCHTDKENKSELLSEDNKKETLVTNPEQPIQPIEQPIQNALQSVHL